MLETLIEISFSVYSNIQTETLKDLFSTQMFLGYTILDQEVHWRKSAD